MENNKGIDDWKYIIIMTFAIENSISVEQISANSNLKLLS